MDSGCADFTNMGSRRMLKCQIDYFDIVDLSANIYLELETLYLVNLTKYFQYQP